jgi:hypothetical protein
MSNSIGNLKNSGLQGNNFPWQLKMLQGQQCACDYLKEIDLNTDQVEPLLVQILAAVQDGTDYEAALVVDANDVTWLEIRIWDPLPPPGAFLPPVYFAAGSNTPGIPVLPITYINPNTYLAQIVSNTTGLATEVTLGDIKTSVQLIDNCVGTDNTTAPANSFVVAGVTSTGVQQTIEVNASGHVNIADGGGSITVDGTVSLSAGTLAALESITVQNGAGAAAVNIQDGGNSITVDAVNLDIRDLDCATDSVSICAGGNPLTSTTIGVTTALDVIIAPTNTVLNLENLEVSAADGDLSAFGSNITSISFFSNGITNALVSVNGGTSFVNVAPGTTINLDANSPSNAYGGTSFFWDTTTNLGSSLIIIYSYI